MGYWEEGVQDNSGGLAL
uniref:Uncharacterized protein n=1 Tax=Moniliophthora roreri TaxID=221103 RepID=A0A0W0FUF9_MONRR